MSFIKNHNQKGRVVAVNSERGTCDVQINGRKSIIPNMAMKEGLAEGSIVSVGYYEGDKQKPFILRGDTSQVETNTNDVESLYNYKPMWECKHRDVLNSNFANFGIKTKKIPLGGEWNQNLNTLLGYIIDGCSNFVVVYTDQYDIIIFATRVEIVAIRGDNGNILWTTPYTYLTTSYAWLNSSITTKGLDGLYLSSDTVYLVLKIAGGWNVREFSVYNGNEINNTTYTLSGYSFAFADEKARSYDFKYGYYFYKNTISSGVDRLIIRRGIIDSDNNNFYKEYDYPLENQVYWSGGSEQRVPTLYATLNYCDDMYNVLGFSSNVPQYYDTVYSTAGSQYCIVENYTSWQNKGIDLNLRFGKPLQEKDKIYNINTHFNLMDRYFFRDRFGKIQVLLRFLLEEYSYNSISNWQTIAFSQRDLLNNDYIFPYCYTSLLPFNSVIGLSFSMIYLNQLVSNVSVYEYYINVMINSHFVSNELKKEGKRIENTNSQCSSQSSWGGLTITNTLAKGVCGCTDRCSSGSIIPGSFSSTFSSSFPDSQKVIYFNEIGSFYINDESYVLCYRKIGYSLSSPYTLKHEISQISSSGLEKEVYSFNGLNTFTFVFLACDQNGFVYIDPNDNRIKYRDYKGNILWEKTAGNSNIDFVVGGYGSYTCYETGGIHYLIKL